MLKLQSKLIRRKPDRHDTSTFVGVAWLNGDLKVSTRGPHGGQTWSADAPVRTGADLSAALRRAVDTLAPTDRRAALLLSHPQLSQTFLEVPQGSADIIHQLVVREVERQKSFAGSAVWRDEPVALHAGGNGRLLHLLPGTIHEEVTAAFDNVGLQLVLLMPASEAVSELKRGNEPKEGGALIAALIPGGLVLTVRQKSKVLLVRSIPLASVDTERIGTELRRTVSFVQQQFQVVVGGISLAAPTTTGESLHRLASSLATTFELLNEPTADYWSTWAVGCGTDSRINLLSREYNEAPKRRRVSRWSRQLGLASLGIAAGLSAGLEILRTNELAIQRQLGRERIRLEEAASESRVVLERLRRQQFLVAAWDTRYQPPLHLWLPGYLALILPPGLVLTNLNLVTETNGWRLGLAGCSTKGGVVSEREASALLTELSAAPLHLQTTLQEPGAVFRTTNGSTLASWSQRIQGTPPDSTRPTRFKLEGYIP